MDIEEIKERLMMAGTQPEPDIKPPGALDGWSINDPYTSGARAVPDALLWIIEKLQETPTVQVAHLAPGDVVLVRARYPLTQHDRESLLTHFSRAFPTNGVIVTDDVEEVLAVRPERWPCVCEHDDGCPRLREHDEQRAGGP